MFILSVMLDSVSGMVYVYPECDAGLCFRKR